MVNGQRLAAVVVAAGRSARMGFDKMFCTFRGIEVLRHSVNAMDAHPMVDEIVVVAGQSIERITALFAAHPVNKPLRIVSGGDTRTHSVKAGVNVCESAQLVAVHDGARPFVSRQLITRVVLAAEKCGAAAPGLPLKDTVKRVKKCDDVQDESEVLLTLPREELMAVQTPQVFCRTQFLSALEKISPEEYTQLTDDCMVMERAGKAVCIVQGEQANLKITTPEDLREQAEPAAAKSAVQRIGYGYDLHRLVPDRAFILGGVHIEHDKGLLGHSDADVLLHSVADALLGAAALGDIGRHFPDTDPAYKGANSMELLGRVVQLIHSEGCTVCNVDATVVCQAPKLAPHIPEMCENIARVLCVKVDAVCVKATTEEKLGYIGEGQAVAVHSVALLHKYT